MSSTSNDQNQDTTQDTVANLAAIVHRLENLTTLPKPYDLYYAVTNKPHGTGWNYVCAGIGVTGLREALDAITRLKLEVGRRFTIPEMRAIFAARNQDYALIPQAELLELRAELALMRVRKDEAYHERNKVVAALARLFPSGTAKTAIPGWSEDWHGCVYIDLPTGQVSWHFHDSQSYLFEALPAYQGEYDGHDTEEKYRRLFRMGLQHSLKPDLDKVLASCEGEQYKFEEWAVAERCDMREHPLHYLFLDPKTNAARQGWKAALRYVQAAVAVTPITERSEDGKTFPDQGNVFPNPRTDQQQTQHEKGATKTHIRLNRAEIQSGLDRVQWAEGLIRQLPTTHDGRNSWLLNYSKDKHEADKVSLPVDPAVEKLAEHCVKHSMTPHQCFGMSIWIDVDDALAVATAEHMARESK